YSAIQLDLIKGYKDAIIEAQQEWEQMTPFQRFAAGGSEGGFVTRAIYQYKRNYIDPLMKEMEPVLEEFRVEGTDQMSGVLLRILDEGFEHGGSPLTVLAEA